jgi:hypothetical protein
MSSIVPSVYGAKLDGRILDKILCVVDDGLCRMSKEAFVACF